MVASNMNFRIIQRLFNVSSVRITLKSNNSTTNESSLKILENNRLNTDDLLIGDTSDINSKVNAGLVVGDKAKEKTTEKSQEKNKENPEKTSNDTTQADSVLRTTFPYRLPGKFHQTFGELKTGDNLQEEINKKIEDALEDIKTPNAEITFETKNDDKMTVKQKKEVPPIIHSQENQRSPEVMVILPPFSDNQAHPPTNREVHSCQDNIGENRDHHNYQDYINSRIDEESPNQESKKIPNTKLDKMITENQYEIDAARFKPHLRPIPSAKDYCADDYMWSPTVEEEKPKDKNKNEIISSLPLKRIDVASMLGKPKTPDLYAPHSDELRNYESSTVDLNKNIKRNLNIQQTQIPSLKTSNSEAVSPLLDPLSPPSLKHVPLPGQAETNLEQLVTTIPQKDYLKMNEPGLATSYDLVPGPSLLKTIGHIWKYVPVLGTQCVSSSIYAYQTIVNYLDKYSEYPSLNPYYYLLNKYGPMVRLSGPLGADILVLAVNGQDFPLIHLRQKGGKYQSLFDSLNIYRDSVPLLAPILDFPDSWPTLPDNPSISIDQYYGTIEKLTDDFIKEKRFIYGTSGTTENESHYNDLIRWALQCNLEVYFKSKMKCMVDSYGNESNNLVDTFIKASKSLSSSETGLQLWRIFQTFTWMDLYDNCKQIDRFILDEVNECLTLLNKGMTSGAALEKLLATQEINGNDIFTSLLDLLIINVNIVASTTGFLLYNLSKSPKIQKSLFREVSSVVQKSSKVSLDDLSNLKYLHACINETLRVSPPFPVLKRLLETEMKIHRFKIPKGTHVHMVNILPYAKGSNGFRDIGKFQAERWTDTLNSPGGDPLAGLPQWNNFPKFNRDLVMTQIALLVTKVVREYRIEYPTHEIYPNNKVLQGPSSPFNFTFLERTI